MIYSVKEDGFCRGVEVYCKNYLKADYLCCLCLNILDVWECEIGVSMFIKKIVWKQTCLVKCFFKAVN